MAIVCLLITKEGADGCVSGFIFVFCFQPLEPRDISVARLVSLGIGVQFPAGAEDVYYTASILAVSYPMVGGGPSVPEVKAAGPSS
jgi:hypothetical protein